MSFESKKVNYVLNYIGNSSLNKIDEFIGDMLERKYHSFSSMEEAIDYFSSYIDLIHKSKIDNIDAVRYYSGIGYKSINSILRGKWDYEANGVFSDEKRREVDDIVNKINEVIYSNESINMDIICYRGVNLSAFSDYGINLVEDLSNLKGKYYLDQGFTSTSLLESKCFFNRELDYHSKCNILIKYLVPKENCDGLPLLSDDLTYSKVQCEYLIQNFNLSKIVDVEYSGDIVIITMAYIPRCIWDKNYNLNKKSNKK